MDFSRKHVMGILNITPDSFYDGNKYLQEKDILNRVEQILNEGADIVDIGAFSSRPGAKLVSYKEERERLIPNLKKIVKKFPEAIISIDTFRHQIAKEAIEVGAHIINDISAGNLDDKMFEVIEQLQVPYIIMHMKGIPENMQDNPHYENVIEEIKTFFENKINQLKKHRIHKVIIDPGFGFGKTLAQNFQILNNLKEFSTFEKTILVGISRKSMLYKLLNKTPDDVLLATSVAHTIALLNGANILRVHDVAEAVEVIKIVESLKNSE